MHFDDFLEVIGPFGRFQKRIFLLLSLAVMMDAFHGLDVVFTLGTAKHRCSIPDLPGDTFRIQSEFHRQLINISIPSIIDSDGNIKYDECDRYIVNISDIDAGRGQKVPCDAWVYDKSVFEATFATENNLVCEKTLWTSTASMMYFLGLVEFFLGLLSDRYGRKKTMCFVVTLLFMSTMPIAFITNFYVFCALRLLTGIASARIYLSAVVIGMEIVAPAKRILTGSLIAYAYSMGLIVLAGAGYFLRHWKNLAIAGSSPIILFLLYWWFIPESPRWLINKGRPEEAKVILRKMAKENGVTIDEKQLDEIESDLEAPSGHLKQLFTNRTLLFRTFIITLNGIAVSMVYYGVSLSSETLSGNFYLNFFLSGLVDFPAYTLCLVFLDRTGRRKLHTSFMFLGGLACISTIFTMLYLETNLQPITVVLAMLGKLGAAAGSTIIYIWAAELYPTCVRHAGVGLSQMLGNVGGIVSPYVADLSKVFGGQLGQALPLAIFGGVTFLAGALSLYLPETLNQRLPETIEDGINLGKEKEYRHVDQKENDGRSTNKSGVNSEETEQTLL